MASRVLIILVLVAALVCVAECSDRVKRGGGYGGGYGGGGGGYGGYGNKYGPYYDKFDFYYGIPGFNTYSKYGQGDSGYAKAVFAGGYGGYGGY